MDERRVNMETFDNENQVEVYIARCSENAVLPFYAKPGDAGMDIIASQEVILNSGETRLVPTGLKVAIPEGYEIQVRPRSGLSLHTPLRITNSPGTIDSGYRDEICVILSNASTSDEQQGQPFPITTKGNRQGCYRILPGDRIAQLVLQKVPRIVWKETDSVSQIGCDRKGGFGSTGEKT
jgi:dUTP pyrophosphatase